VKAAAPAAAKPAPAPVADELDFTAPVEINNPFGEGKVEVTSDDLDFSATTQELGPEIIAAAKEAAAEVSKAEAGKPAAPAKPAARPNVQKAIKRETVRLPSAMIMGAWVEIVDADNVNDSFAIQDGVLPSSIAPILPALFIPNGRILGALQSLVSGVYKGPFAQRLLAYFKQRGQRAEIVDLTGRSDHFSFEQIGVPTGGLFAGVDNCYHARCDRLDAVDLTLLKRLASAAAFGVASIAPIRAG